MKRNVPRTPTDPTRPLAGKRTAARAARDRSDAEGTPSRPILFVRAGLHRDGRIRDMNEIAQWTARSVLDDRPDPHDLALLIHAFEQALRSCPSCDLQTFLATYPYLFVPFTAKPR